MKTLMAVTLLLTSWLILGTQGQVPESKQQLTAAKVYFLSFGKDKEPSDEFITRFKDHKPPVKKRSQSMGQAEVIDKETGERGLIFRAVSIKVIDANTVEVGGGYYEAGLSASGNVYTVERNDGKWIVTKDQMLWIS